MVTLTYDAENRLTGINGGGVMASYTHDGDSGRVKAVIGSSTTVYVGSYYEQTTSGGNTTITKYYQAGGKRIALRVNGVVRWLATDHLGSTAVTANETGARIAELRDKPWGENRYSFGATPTLRRFTGQVLDDAAGGLYFYHAHAMTPLLRIYNASPKFHVLDKLTLPQYDLCQEPDMQTADGLIYQRVTPFPPLSYAIYPRAR